MLGWLAHHPRMCPIVLRVLRCVERGHVRLDTLVALVVDAAALLFQARQVIL